MLFLIFVLCDTVAKLLKRKHKILKLHHLFVFSGKYNYLCTTMKKRCLTILTFLLVLVLGAQAQLPRRFLRRGTFGGRDSNPVVEQYRDSLKALHDSIYGSKAQPSGFTSSPRLFLPPTFYKDIPHRALSVGDSLSFADRQLLNVYLFHPELVEQTDAQIEPEDEQYTEPQQPITRQEDLSDHVAPVPIEPEHTPVTVLLKKPNFWTYKGDYSLQFMQNYVSGNWYKGGESNYSALASVTMEANYNNKQKLKWENKLEMRFGLQSARSDSLHNFKTTEDLFRITSKLGIQASKRWYYTLQFLAYSQFTHSYKSNDPTLYSDFLAPLNVNLSLGMDYNVDWIHGRLKGTIHLAPLAYNLKYTRLVELSERLGIDAGHHVLNDFGSEFTIDLTWQLMEMLQWKTRLYGYTSYERAELEWENTFVFKFNRWISAQLFVYPRFDDGAQRDGHHGYWQFKEYASIGFQYSF